jgi:hypothetical protein
MICNSIEPKVDFDKNICVFFSHLLQQPYSNQKRQGGNIGFNAQNTPHIWRMKDEIPPHVRNGKPKLEVVLS